MFFVVCLACAPAVAGTWSGYLVDASCYKIRQENTNPTNTDDYVNRDRGLMVQLCRPTKKTKQFTVVEENGLSFNLDSSGNAEAAQIVAPLAGNNAVNKKRTKSYFLVVVKGDNLGHTVQVTSISLQN